VEITEKSKNYNDKKNRIITKRFYVGLTKSVKKLEGKKKTGRMKKFYEG